MTDVFPDRFAAGRAVGRALASIAGDPSVLVLGLPRGGIPVAFEVARALGAPLDIFVVRKLGVPGHEELAMGAIASGGVRVLNEDVLADLGITGEELERVAAREQGELERRQLHYRAGRPAPLLRDRTVVLVDDGLATGSTMRAAALAVRQQHPRRLIIAVPVAPPSTCAALRQVADDVVCVRMPEHFAAVGYWYDDFSQTTDEEVRELLARTSRTHDAVL